MVSVKKNRQRKTKQIKKIHLTYNVPLNKVLLTRSIVKAIKDYGGIVPSNSFWDPDHRDLPLNRMNQNLSIEGDKLPIIVHPLYNVQNKQTFYQIIQGRHRYACAVIQNNTFIKIKNTLYL